MKRRERKPRGYWDSYENCYNAAKECKIKSEFIEKYGRAYIVSVQNGWIKDYTFFKKTRNPDGWWEVKEHCREEAMKYTRKRDFWAGSNCAYKSARINGWLKDYWWLNEGEPRSEVYCVYTYEDSVNKYAYAGLTNNIKRRDKEHRRGKNNDSVYRHFKKFGLDIPKPIIVKSGLTKKEAKIEEENLVNSILEKGWNKINIAKPGSTGGVILKWDYDACKELSKMCKTPTDFLAANRSAYEISKEKGWIYEFYPDFKKRHFYTYEECKQYASVCRSKTDLRRLCYGAYMKALDNGWLDDFDFIPTGQAISIGHTKWHYDNCKEDAAKYKQVTDFQKGSKGAYMAAKRNGWLDDFFPETKHPRRYNHSYWTYERCKEAASKYKRRRDFDLCCRGGYKSAWRNGWLDDFFGEKNIKPLGFWNDKSNCKEEAAKYKTRSEFSDKCGGGYNSALDHGWLDEFFPKAA